MAGGRRATSSMPAVLPASRPRLVALLVALAVAGALATSGSAAASTADISGTTLEYAAAPGETNHVALSRDAGGYRIVDPGATITPTAPCAAVSATEVTCPTAGVTAFSIVLGDMNDTETLAASVVDIGIGISGDAGTDTLSGGAGSFSSMSGGDGSDTLNAGSLGDDLSGDDGTDVLNGGAGGDSLNGGAGNDVENGNGGNDELDSSDSTPNGADTLNGGPGEDEVSYAQRRANVSLTQDGVADDGEAGEGDNVAADVEDIFTGAGNDVISASNADNEIQSLAGNDTIDGGGGSDEILGGNGDDVMNGGSGADFLSGDLGNDVVGGGAGDDTLRNSARIAGADDGADTYSGGPGSDLVTYNASDPVDVTLDGVAGDGVAGENDNVMADVENVTAGSAADVLVGNGSANELDGGNGNDVIRGLGGDDGLDGGRGDDSLDGGPGTDLLSGDSGADTLRTRDGSADESSCGAGVDTVLADQLDPLRPDCEQTSTGLAFETKRAKVAPSGKAKVKLACPAVEGIACKGTLILRRAAKKGNLARAKVSIPSGKAKAVKLKVKGLGAGRTATSAKATMKDATGAKVTSSERLVLVR
jgi:Ca2+-binding RTX toxin-like protein